MGVDYEQIEKEFIKPKNTVLDELEEWLKEQIKLNVDGIRSFSGYQCKETLNKIQELKKENENG